MRVIITITWLVMRYMSITVKRWIAGADGFPWCSTISSLNDMLWPAVHLRVVFWVSGTPRIHRQYASTGRTHRRIPSQSSPIHRWQAAVEGNMNRWHRRPSTDRNSALGSSTNSVHSDVQLNPQKTETIWFGTKTSLKKMKTLNSYCISGMTLPVSPSVFATSA